MVRKIFIIKLGIFILGLNLASAANKTVKISFDDLSKFIQSKNQNITSSNLLIDAADARTGHLVRSYLPNVRAELGAETFQTGPYRPSTEPYGSAEAKINVFRGGRDLLEEKVRESHLTLAQTTAKRIFATELSEARRLYWKIVFNQEVVNSLKASVQQNEKQLEMANRRIARGLSTETDRLDFQIHAGQLHEEIESLTHETKLLQISLSAVLGMNSNAEFQTQDAILHIHDEALLKASIEPSSHPDVLALKANQNSFASQRSQSNRWWTPSLDVYAGYSLHTLRERDYLSQSLRNDYVAGLRLSFELFDGFQSKANGAAFALQENAYEEQSAQRTRSVDAQIQVAKEDLKHDHELIHFSEERVEQGNKYLARTLDEYNRGVKNSIDLLGAAQRYVAFQRQYAERRLNYQITKSNLLALLGK